MLPWIFDQQFSPAYRTFTFDATAHSTAKLRLQEAGATFAGSALAPLTLDLANLTVWTVALNSVRTPCPLDSEAFPQEVHHHPPGPLPLRRRTHFRFLAADRHPVVPPYA
jgi:hypothetical protein